MTRHFRIRARKRGETARPVRPQPQRCEDPASHVRPRPRQRAGATRPVHDVGEEARFESDFYAYLDAPENSTRYLPTIEFVSRQRSGRPWSVLDLGCGSAPLAALLPARVAYTGIDHAELAIERCRERFPRQRFISSDVARAVRALARARERFDVVVLCGVLSHLVDKRTLVSKDDRRVVARCLADLLLPDGFLSLVVGVPYRSDARFGLYAQAQWKQSIVDAALAGVRARRVCQTLSLQLGLEAKIRRQSTRPDWFIERPDEATENRHTGERLAALTVIVTGAAARSTAGC